MPGLFWEHLENIKKGNFKTVKENGLNREPAFKTRYKYEDYGVVICNNQTC